MLQFFRARKAREVLWGGTIVLGQDQDEPGGGFSLGQVFSGRLDRVGVWARALSVQEVSDVAKCEAASPPGDLLPWGSSVWQAHGRVRFINTSFCQHFGKQFFPFWERAPFSAATAALGKLGMVLAVPNSQKETELIKEMLQNAPSICASPYSDTKYLYINVFFNKTTGFLLDLTSNSSLKLNITVGPTYGKMENGIVTLRSDGKWVVSTETEHCYLGEYEGQHNIFHLHGLCDVSTSSKDYKDFVLSTNEQQPMYLAGLAGAQILQEGTFWVLSHRYREGMMATIQSTSLPLGRREWNVTAQDLYCTYSLGPKMLTLSTCSNSEYTCNDGSCVSLSNRCNLVSDCQDWSDEHYCETVSLPVGYLPQLPPPPPIIFNLSVVFKHVELDLKTMTFVTKIYIKLEWYDRRIEYLNLRDEASTNMVTSGGERDASEVVWVPRLEWNDMVDQGPFSSPAVYIVRQTNGSRKIDGKW